MFKNNDLILVSRIAFETSLSEDGTMEVSWNHTYPIGINRKYGVRVLEDRSVFTLKSGQYVSEGASFPSILVRFTGVSLGVLGYVPLLLRPDVDAESVKYFFDLLNNGKKNCSLRIKGCSSMSSYHFNDAGLLTDFELRFGNDREYYKYVKYDFPRAEYCQKQGSGTHLK